MKYQHSAFCIQTSYQESYQIKKYRTPMLCGWIFFLSACIFFTTGFLQHILPLALTGIACLFPAIIFSLRGFHRRANFRRRYLAS